MRSGPLFQLTLLRFREFVREPEAVFWNFAFPLLLTAGLGVAFREQPPQPLPVAAVSAPLAAALRADPQLRVQEQTHDGALALLRNGRVTMVAEPGPDASTIYHFDANNPDARAARMVVDRAVQVAAGRRDPVPVSNALVREPGSRYIDFLVPGMIGMGLMNGGMWGLVFSIVDTRRRKLLKRIVATPMPRHYYLLSFLCWRLVLLPFEVGIPLGFSVLAFGVPLRGSAWELALLCLLGALTFGAVGLLISSRARTIEGASGIMNLVQLPMWIVSGVFFSAERFPEAVQPLVRALPLTALIDAMRGNMLQGTPLTQMAAQLAPLAVCLVGCFAVALKIFRWR